MTDQLNPFVPVHLDFELRAIALCDYQNLIANPRETADHVENDGLSRQHFLWILGSLIRIGYLPYSSSEIIRNEQEFAWTKQFSTIHDDVMKIANAIGQNKTVLALANTNTEITRKKFLEDIKSIATECMSNFELRTSVASLKTSTYNDASLWTLALEDDPEFQPWFIPKLCDDHSEDVIDKRVQILKGLQLALEGDLARFDHYSQISEFGIPQISLLKITDEVRLNSLVSNVTGIYPAEVATLLSRMQTKFGITDRRRFVIKLKQRLDVYLGPVSDPEDDYRNEDLYNSFFLTAN